MSGEIELSISKQASENICFFFFLLFTVDMEFLGV